MSHRSESLAPGLRWLIRLRWLALAGQGVLFLVGAAALRIDFPLGIVIPCLAITAASNLLVSVRGDRFPETAACALLLLLDTLTLTVLLYWLGGAHNPFTAFYVLHITIAALLLPALWTWLGVGICAMGYGLLFASPHPIESAAGISCCGSFDFHLQGMLLAMVLVGMCIAFFVGQLKAALARREAELHEARVRAVQNEKFAGLATLAAGVAHELATPLSTIAVISSDLGERACSQCRHSGCLTDAELIRSEVERCRSILEKLGESTTDNIGENAQAVALGSLPGRLRGFLSEQNFQRLAVDVPSPGIELFVPITTLLQSLAVLVKNACDADESGRPVRLTLTASRGRVTARVEDQGAGMTPEVSARAGEPFFTTKEPGRGMGLGLFLVRMFAERMKGSLVIHSVPSRGSTVCLEFPVTKDVDENRAD
ncbi:MAG TPA: ATP-binding protein [Terrimicrobiaceae bacterium]|nr:ATP-binding protein [Terrimicrobiaceae bacterium]